MDNRHKRAAHRNSGTTHRSTRRLVGFGAGLAAGAAVLAGLLAPVGPATASPSDARPDVVATPLDTTTTSARSGSLYRSGPDSTQLMLGGGLVALGLGSITAVLTRPRDEDDIASLT